MDKERHQQLLVTLITPKQEQHLNSGTIQHVMKRCSGLFLFLLIALFAPGQVNSNNSTSSEKEIPAIEQQRWSASIYKQQTYEWQQQAVLNPADEKAWLNWYKSERYSNYTAHSRSISKNSQYNLTGILSNMEQHVPESPEFHFAKYLDGNKSEESFDHLVLAYALDPNNTEYFDDMLALSVIRKDVKNQQFFARKMLDAHLFSEAEMEYNRNVLNSVTSGGVLVTYGNGDTYPVLIMQLLNMQRTDITVICLDWIGSETYRKQLSVVFGDALNSGVTDESQFLKKLLESKSGKKFYLGLTLPPDELRKYSNSVYLTGLVLEYNNQQTDNLPVLANNWEVYFQKDHITDSEPINRNYLLPLTELTIYYKNQGHVEKAEETTALVNNLTSLIANPAIVTKYID